MEAWSEEEREFWTLRQAVEDSRGFTQFLRQIENRTTKVAITESVMRAVMAFVTARDRMIVDGFINGTFGGRTRTQHQSSLKIRNLKLASLSFCVDSGDITADKLQKNCRSLRKLAVNWGTRVVIPAIDRLEAINDLNEEMLKLGIKALKEDYRRVDGAVENLRELDQQMHHMLRIAGEVVSIETTNSGERENTDRWR